MWTVPFRDVAEVPALQSPMADFTGLVTSIANDLAASFGGGSPKEIAITLKHALAFPTWSDLDGLGLDNSEKTRLVSRWLGDASRASGT